MGLAADVVVRDRTPPPPSDVLQRGAPSPAGYGQKEAIEWLIGRQVDLNPLNAQSQTPLDLAKSKVRGGGGGLEGVGT